MRILTYFALVIGLGLAVVLVAWHGFDTIVSALAGLGAWVLLLPLLYSVHLLGAAISWGQLFLDGQRPAFPVLLRTVWIGTSVEAMVPTASLGGEFAKARLLIRAGLRGNEAASYVVADVTVQALVLAAWAIVGLCIMAFTEADAALKWTAAVGAGGLAVGCVGFLLLQRAGLFGFLAKAGVRMLRQARWQGVTDGAATLDATMRAIYGRPQCVILAVAIRCLSRSAVLMELWLVARLMGYPIGIADAGMMMGLIGALRAATVVVPGGWGVQEGGFIVLGGLIGLPPQAMLAISLASRAREFLVGIPAIATWQILEGRSLKKLLASDQS